MAAPPLASCNEALLLRTVDDLVITEWPMPVVRPDEVLVAIQRVGICGSDVHYWKEGAIGDFVLKAPMVIGHESAGVVARVGTAVEGLAAGDRVALEPGVPCDACELCWGKKYNLCPVLTGSKQPTGKQGFFATPPVHGSLARYVSHPAKFCFKIPADVTLEEGAMCEPLSVGVYACEQKAKVTPGSSVAVFGAGTIGTICAMVAHGLGAARVVLCDVLEERLVFCREKCCPVETLNSRGLSSEEVAERIKALNAGEPVDGAIECSGAEPCLQAAILCTKNGGVCCLVGMGKSQMSLPILNASVREVDLCGVFRYRHTYPKCLEMLAKGKIDISALITHRFEFTQASAMDAFETCRTGRDGAIKCMIRVGDAEEQEGPPRKRLRSEGQ